MIKLLLSLFFLSSITGHTQVEWNHLSCDSAPSNPNSAAFLNSIVQTPDGGYVLVGSAPVDITPTNSNMQVAVVKLAADGTELWHKFYGGSTSGIEIAYKVQLTNDNGFIVLATTNSIDGGDMSGSHGGQDFWILKLDENGNLQWSKTLGGSDDEGALAWGDSRMFSTGQIRQTSDGYILACSTRSLDGDAAGNHGGADGWLVKLDNSGNMVWQKCIGGTKLIIFSIYS